MKDENHVTVLFWSNLYRKVIAIVNEMFEKCKAPLFVRPSFILVHVMWHGNCMFQVGTLGLGRRRLCCWLCEELVWSSPAGMRRKPGKPFERSKPGATIWMCCIWRSTWPTWGLYESSAKPSYKRRSGWIFWSIMRVRIDIRVAIGDLNQGFSNWGPGTLEAVLGLSYFGNTLLKAFINNAW